MYPLPMLNSSKMIEIIINAMHVITDIKKADRKERERIVPLGFHVYNAFIIDEGTMLQ